MQLTRSLSLIVALAGAGAALSQAPQPEARPVTLEQCFQMALKGNFDIQLQRISPQMAQYALSESQWFYEPSFSASARHGFQSSPGGVDQQGRLYAPTETEADWFDVGLSGSVPVVGLNYDITTSLRDTYGTRPTLVPDLANPIHNIVTITNVDRPWETFSYDQVTYPMLPARESFENSGGSVQISMSQPLLKNGWIDGPRMAITLRKKDLKQSEWALQGQIMRTITEVQVAYYNLIASRELVKVREKALQEAEQQLRENKKRVEVGVMAPLDEKQAESQVAESRASLIRAQGDLAVNQNRLKNLLTDKYSEWRDVVLEPTETLLATVQVFNRQDSWHKGLSLRPDLVTAKIDLEKQNITLRYRRNQLFPELDLVGSYGQLGAGAEFSDSLGGIARGDSPSYSYGAVLRIPLSNRAERYRYKSAKALKEQAVLRLKQLEQTVMQQIDDAIIQAQSSLQQVEASKQASSFAEAAYQAEQKKMESGKSTSFQVLILQRILTERRAAEISSLTAYNIALAYLAQAEGSTLERMGIQVTTK